MWRTIILAVVLCRVLGSVITTDVVTGDNLVAIDVSRAGLYVFGKKPCNWVIAIEDRGRLEVSASHSKTCLFSVIQPRFRASYQLRAEPFQKLPWDMNAEAEVELDTVATFLLLMPTKKKVIHCEDWMRLVGLKTAMRIADFDEWMVTPRNPHYAVVKFTVISDDSQEPPAALTTSSTSRTPRLANTMSSLSRLVTPRSADSLKPPLQNPISISNTSNVGATRDRLPTSRLDTPRSADSLQSTFQTPSNSNYRPDSLAQVPEPKPLREPPRRYSADSQTSWGFNSGKSTSVLISYEGWRRPRISEWRPKPRRPRSRSRETRATRDEMDELVTQLDDVRIESDSLTNSDTQSTSEDFAKVVVRRVGAENC